MKWPPGTRRAPAKGGNNRKVLLEAVLWVGGLAFALAPCARVRRRWVLRTSSKARFANFSGTEFYGVRLTPSCELRHEDPSGCPGFLHQTILSSDAYYSLEGKESVRRIRFGLNQE
jgi:hypothetical protein